MTIHHVDKKNECSKCRNWEPIEEPQSCPNLKRIIKEAPPRKRLIHQEVEHCHSCLYLFVDKESGRECVHDCVMNRVSAAARCPKEGMPSWCPLPFAEEETQPGGCQEYVSENVTKFLKDLRSDKPECAIGTAHTELFEAMMAYFHGDKRPAHEYRRLLTKMANFIEDKVF